MGKRVKVDGKSERRTCEIDFVAHQGCRRYYVQSAFRLDTPEKAAQEKRSLLGVGDSFRKIVVVKDVMRPESSIRYLRQS